MVPVEAWLGGRKAARVCANAGSRRGGYLLAYKAVQEKLEDKGFLSRDITIHDLLMNCVTFIMSSRGRETKQAQS
jgi:hypothetical protein